MNILETARQTNSTAPPLHGRIVDVAFGGVDPGSCSNPEIIKCPQEGQQVCTSSSGFAEGICK